MRPMMRNEVLCPKGPEGQSDQPMQSGVPLMLPGSQQGEDVTYERDEPPGSAGGRARASKLSTQEREEIPASAASAR